MLSINTIYNTTSHLLMCNILNVMSNNISLQSCQIVFAVGISYLYILPLYILYILTVNLYFHIVILFYCFIVLYRWHTNFLRDKQSYILLLLLLQSGKVFPEFPSGLIKSYLILKRERESTKIYPHPQYFLRSGHECEM